MKLVRFVFPFLLLSLLFVFSVLIFSTSSFSQGEQTPEATATPEFFKAAQKFARVDKNKNKILDDLEKRISPAAATDRFDVIVMLNKPLDLLPTLKGRHDAFTEKFTYPAINGFATNLTKGQVIAFSKDADVKLVEFDALAYPHLDSANDWFGTAKARADFGVDGNADGSSSYSKNDIVIAVIDTGIDPDHVDLDGGKIIGWKDFATGKLSPYDQVRGCGGHGTHVSSIVAGEGEGNSLYNGVVPGAALVGVKVLKRTRGNDCTGSISDVDAGIQWVIDNKDTYGIEVMNMSIGTSGSSDGTDSTSQLVNSAVDAGIVAAVSAGNEGPEKYTIGSPSAAEKAITVGAMADVDPGTTASFSCGNAPGYGFYQVCFSSRGPTADERIKPDISAPGVFIMAAEAGTTNDYTEYSGTSMASPFIAGLAGLILHANPSLTPAQVKTKIMNTALDWGPSGDDVDYGAGRLDGYKAVKNAGGYSGTNIATPEHQYFTGSLAGTGSEDWYDINIADTSYPIVVALIMPDWVTSTNPNYHDFDLYLYDTDGTTELDRSISTTRQDTVGYQPTTTGTYKLRVYSYDGSGNYFFDQSASTAAVAISLTTDGTTPFGAVALGQTVDSLGDVQTIKVLAGPADLNIKSTNFSDGGHIWTLNSNNGANQVKWEFSKDGLVWAIFSSANTLFGFDTNVAAGSTRDLYLRLTMPTATSSNDEHESTVTITATQP